jgi:hypothetical protein
MNGTVQLDNAVKLYIRVTPFVNPHVLTYCSARDWERSGLLEENPQSGCSDICASLKGVSLAPSYL